MSSYDQRFINDCIKELKMVFVTTCFTAEQAIAIRMKFTYITECIENNGYFFIRNTGKKKRMVGDLICRQEMSCKDCPLKVINHDMLEINSDITLNEITKKIKSFDNDLYKLMKRKLGNII